LPLPLNYTAADAECKPEKEQKARLARTMPQIKRAF
jgi:hypothetical protein